jgi:hypothetical protein
MYGIDESIQSESGIKIINVGISENCFLDKVTFGPASEKAGSASVLCFNFKQDGGAIFRHIEWPIDKDKETANGKKYYENLVKLGKTPEEPLPLFVNAYVKRVYTDQAARVKHIMSKFMSETECIIPPVATFEQFGNAVINILSNKFENKKLRLKLIYNSKDYAVFPKYPNFVEVQGDATSTLRLTPRDRVAKQVPDSGTGNPAESEY